MKPQKGRWNRRLNGEVKVERILRANWAKTKADRAIKAKYKYRWEPPYQVACQLPEGFALEFECWVGKDGVRRFVPCKHLTEFVLEAALAGHAILADRNKEGESELPQHEARLFNQFSRCIREYLGETIQLGRLLKINRAGRPDSSTQDILPDDIGMDDDGSGERWSVVQFKQIGCEAAKAAGNANPTPEEIFWFGLHEAAKRNPLRISHAEAEDLMKVAFYALGPDGTKLDPAAVAYVAKHVRASLTEHLNGSREEFERWIQDPKSNLISRIAKRNDCQWTKEEVRRAMLALGWQTLKQLAKCVDAYMRAFALAMPKSLTSAEKRIFGRIYLAERDLGRIPLVVLRERFEVMKLAVLELWRNPGSRKAVGVLRRVLWYYAEIVANRRAGDRQYKRRSIQRNEEERPAIDVPLVEEEADRTDGQVDEFTEAAVRAARAVGYAFEFGAAVCDARVVSENSKMVVFDLACSDRGFGETITVSRKQFAAIANKVHEEFMATRD